jgi:Sigma-70, region 4
MSPRVRFEETERSRSELIYTLRTVDGWTYKRIGNRFGISGPRVRQIVLKQKRRYEKPDYEFMRSYERMSFRTLFMTYEQKHII